MRSIRAFARDPAPEIALPVLRHSPLLPEADLIAVAERQDAERRLAIAQERALPETVTTLLLATADLPLLRAVSGNLKARISQDGFRRLLSASKNDACVTGHLLRRLDTPASFAVTLVEQYRAQISAAIAGGRPIVKPPAPPTSLAPSAARRLPNAVASAASIKTTPASDLAMAEIRVEAMMRKGTLYQEDIAWCLTQRRSLDALVIIAKLARQPPEFVARAFADGEVDLPLAIMRLAGLPWERAQQMLRLDRPMETSGTVPELPHKYRSLAREQAEKAVRRARFLARVTVFRSNKAAADRRYAL